MVTGSVGKTTMLHMLEAALGDKAHVSHNANSSFGLAFDVVGLSGVRANRWKWLYLLIAVPVRSLFYKRQQEFYVAEVDADRPLEAEIVASWLRPEVSAWVSVSNSHAVNFEQLASELSISTDNLIADSFAAATAQTTGAVMYNGESDAMIGALTRAGIDWATPVSLAQLKSYRVTPTKTEYGFKKELLGAPTTISLAHAQPREAGLQLAMTLMICRELGAHASAADFSTITQPPSRTTYLKGAAGYGMIDSSYNAHLESMQSIINMFSEIKHESKWLVIGDIIEQGANEKKEHQRLAAVISGSNVNNIVLVGPRTLKHTKPILGNNDKINLHAFEKPADAMEYLRDSLSKDDLVLFKGSQLLEGIIKNLLASPADESLLCRRDARSQKWREHWGVG